MTWQVLVVTHAIVGCLVWVLAYHRGVMYGTDHTMDFLERNGFIVRKSKQGPA